MTVEGVYRSKAMPAPDSRLAARSARRPFFGTAITRLSAVLWLLIAQSNAGVPRHLCCATMTCASAVLALLCLAAACLAAEGDYYQRLGVPRDASLRVRAALLGCAGDEQQ